MPLFLRLLVLLCTLAGGLSAATVTWSGAVNQNWSNTGNWVGNILPSAADTASFAGQTVTIDNASAVAGGITGSAIITIPSAGLLTVNGTIAASSITLSGGTLSGASVQCTIVCTTTTGTLTNVTIPVGMSLDVGSTNSGAACNLSNVTIAGTVMVGSASNANYGTLYFPGTQLITGGGTILFGGNVNGYNSINSNGGSGITLTVDTGFTIHGKNGSINANQSANTLVNNGTISCDVSGGLITLSTTSWTNNHQISAIAGSNLTVSASTTGTNATGGTIALSTGSVLTVNGTQTWTNAGLISGSGTIFDLGASFSSATGLTIDGSGNTININGQVANGASTIALSTFPWNLVGGTITGGTITGTPPNALICTGNTGTLSNVIIPVGSSLDVGSTNSGAACNLSNVTIAGTVMVGSTSNANYGTLYFPGTQLITGGGTILFGGNVNGYNSINSNGGSGITLTVDTGFTIHGKNGSINANQSANTLVNNGTISCDVSGGLITLSTTSWTNNNQISAIAGSNLTVSASTTGTNATGGTIALSTGSVLTVNGTQTWTNAGLISGSGTIFDLGASFSSATGLTIDGSGNTININGQVANGASTIALSTFPWNLVGGTITGGTITGTPPNALICTGNTGTLSNVIIPVGSSLDVGSTNSGAACNLSNVTIAGTVMVGSTSNANYGTLYFPGTQLITGGGTILFGGNVNGYNSINSNGGSGITLTVDTGFTIHGKNGSINANQSANTLVNNGTISCDVSGGLITLSTTSWTNNNQISAIAGSNLTVSASTTGTNATGGTIALSTGSVLTVNGTQTWTNAGLISGSGTIFDLGASFSSATGLTIDGSGNTININGQVANGASTIALSTFPWNLVGGTITGGTITGTPPNALICTGNTGTLSNVIIPVGSSLDVGSTNSGAACNLSNVTIAGTVMVGSTSNANYGTLYFPGTQLITGGGTILFGGNVNGYNSINSNGGSGITLTVDTGFTIHGKNGSINANQSANTLVNNGTISCDVSGGLITLSTTSWTNNNQISAIAGSNLTVSASTTGTNATGGTIALSTGSVLTVNGTQTWTNAGLISGSGTIFDLGASFSSATGLTIDGSGNTININGQVANGASTIALSTFPWNLVGGTITGGTITGTPPNALICTGNTGTLSNVTIPSGSSLDIGSTNSGAACNLSNVTIAGTVMVGSTSSANYGTLYFPGSQLITGGGTILFGGNVNGYNTINSSGGSGITLTIDTGFTIHGKNGAINANQATNTLVNNGTISNDVAGGSFSISATAFTNNHILSISQGAAETWALSGAFTQSSTGILNMEIGGTGSYDKLTINGTANLGGTLNLTTIDGYYLHQGDAFTLITTNASGLSGNFTAVTGSFGLAYNTAVGSLVATAQDTTTPTVTVSPALAFSPGSPLAFTITFSEPVTGLTSGGITVTNGTVSNLSGSSTTYAATVTPNALGGATNEVVGVTVNADVAKNSGNIFNAAASNTATTTYEIAPTVQVSPGSGAVVGAPPTFTLTFSNPVQGLTMSGLTITGSGASITNVTPNAAALTSSYTVTTAMPGPGAVQFNVNANVVVDQAGNPNPATVPETVTYSTTNTWNGMAGDGNWNSALNWSAGVAPGSGSNVVIPTGTTVTLNVATANLHTLDLIGNLIIASGGILQVANPVTANDNILTLDGGTLTLQGGHLLGAIVQLGSGGSFVATPSGGTLDGVTIAGGTTFDLSQSASSSCTVTNGLVDDGTILIGNAGSNYGSLSWNGSQTWSGNGQIVFGASANNSIADSVASTTLTIQGPLSIHGTVVTLIATSGCTLATQGPLATDAAGDTITITASTWTNSGAITLVGNSILNINGSGTWSNTGTVTASGATFNLGANFLPAAGLSFPGTGNTLNILGTIANAGGTVLSDASGPWYLHGGTITGGTITGSGAGVLIATPSGGTLNGVTIAGGTTFDLSQSASSSCIVTNGLVDDGTILIGNAGSNYGSLSWNGSQTWSGNGQIVFGASANNSIADSVASTTLTIQGPLSIHGTVVTLIATSGCTLATQGPLATDAAGDTITITASTWTNSGAITLVGNSILNINGSGTWSNTGTVTASGATFNLGANFLPAAGLSFPGTGNTLNILGTIANAGGTVLSDASGPWYLHGGTITGGTITGSGAGVLIATPSGGTLNGVTIAGGTTFDLSQSASSSCIVTNGLVDDGTILIGNAGSNYGSLSWNGSQTWSGNGQIVFGASANNSIADSVASTTLTIQGPLSIHGTIVTLIATSGCTLATQGPLATDAAGDTITITASTWTNSGAITLVGNSILNINGSGTWSNTGTVTASGATFNLGANFLPAAGLSFPGTGNTLNILGTIANAGGTVLSDASGPWYLHGGTITGGTITGSGAGVLIATPSGGTLNGVTIAGGTTFDLSQSASSSCIVTNGLVDDGTILIGNAGSNYGSLSWNGSQTWSGNGQIVFGASANNSIADSVASTTLTIQGPLSVHGTVVTLIATSGCTLATQGPLATDAAGDTITITASTWTNSGAITLVGNSILNINGSGTWSNTGTVTASGATFNLGANFLPAAGLSFPGTGNTLNIVGTIANAGGTVLSDASGPWYLHGGTITGGTITGSGAGVLIATPSGGTLNGVTIAGGTTFDLSQSASSSCIVTNGLVDDGTILIGNAGSNYGSLSWNGSQTWSGNGQIVFGASANNSIADSVASTTLTIQGPLSIHGTNGTLTASSGCALVNGGTIASDGAGGALHINATTFTNQGTLTVDQGITATLSITGAFVQASTGVLALELSGTSSHDTLAITGSATLDGTITLTPIAGYQPNQPDAIPVITTTGTHSGAFATVNGLFTMDYSQASSVIADASNTTPPTVVVSTPLAATHANPIPFTLTFSQPVTLIGSVQIANGTAGAPTGGPSVYALSVTPTGQGLVTVTVPIGMAQSAPSITNTAAGSASATFDSIAPTAIITPNGTSTNQPSIPFTVAFSEVVSAPVALGFVVTNGTISSISSGPAASYTVTVAVTGPAVTLQLAPGAVSDLAGNPSAVTPSATVTHDTTPPTVLSVLPTGTATDNAAISFQVTFSKPVNPLLIGDLTIANGTIGTITGGGTTYTVPVTATSEGDVTLTVVSASDLAGNLLAGTLSATVTYDITPPTVTSISPNGTITNAAQIPFVITFSEAVDPLVAGDLMVGNGTLQGITGSGTTYTATVLPSGQGTVSIAVTAASDLAGNPLAVTAAAAAAVTFDTVAPTILSITPTGGAPTNASPVDFVVTFSEPIQGVAAMTTNGTPQPTSGGPTVITFPVIPSSNGTVTISFPAGSFTDLAGNANTAAASATVTFSSTSPSVVVTPTLTATNQPQITFTLTFSSAVTGLTTGGLQVTNGTLGLLSGSGTTYTIPVTPIADGVVSLAVSAGAATDLASNPNLASAAATVTYDTIPPTVSSITPDGTATNGPTISFVVTFSEAITGLGAGNLTIGNGTLGTISGGPTAWTVTVSPTAQGAVTLAVASASDLAGNALSITAADAASVTYDTVPPTVAVTPTGTATNQPLITFTLTFSEAVAGLSAGALTVTNGTLGALSGGPSVYAIPVTPNANGPVTLAVPAGVASDVAGNLNTASTIASVTYSTIQPTVAVTPTGTATNQPQITFTLTFSAPVSGLTTAGLMVGNGTLGALSGGPSVYTIPVTPIANGPVTLQVQAGVADDLSGNPNLASPVASVTYDTVLPTVAVTPSGTATNHGPITFTITFSAPVAGLSAAGLAVTNGTLGALSGGGAVYTIPVTPIANGPVSLQVDAGAASDVAGNGNAPSTTATVTYQTLAPTAAVTPDGTTSNQAPIIFTLTFSAPVVGLSVAGLVVGNGTLGAISGGPAAYTVPVTPTANGPVTLQVAAGAAQDAAGNPNTASPVASVLYDTVPPSISLGISSPLPLTVTSTTLTITFSKPVTGFTAGGIAATNATISGFAAVNASTYTAIINPLAPITASVQIAIPAGAASDLAGNPSLAGVLILSQQSTVASTTVATPAVATSSAGGTVYGALCPGTWNGLAQVQAFLAGKTDAQARGFVWDAVVQDFVQVPAQAPTGGWQPFQGVFLATRQPASFDFNGSMATLDYELVLKPGWNFVGLPPLDDNGVELVSHQWVDLRLEDTAGNLLSGAQRTGLIDVGPWLWDGTSYSQVTVMQTGLGYWIDNASSPGVDLVLRRLSSAEIAGTAPILGAAHGAAQGAGGTAAAATIGYHAHGTPPMPPGLGSGNHDSATHGCGLGSGIGALLALTAAFLLRMRLRGQRWT